MSKRHLTIWLTPLEWHLLPILKRVRFLDGQVNDLLVLCFTIQWGRW